MKVTPKKKPSFRLDKSAAVTLAVIAVLLISTILLVNTCSDRSGTGDATDSASGSDIISAMPPVADEDSGNAGNTEDTEDDFIFIPIENTGASSPSLAVTEAEMNAALLQVSQDLGEEHIEKYLFLCDSVIYGMKSLGMLADGQKTDKVITGVASSFSLASGKEALVYLPERDSVLTAPDAMSEISPEYLLVSVGTDELIKRPEISDTDFYNSYRELIMSLREASPATVIVCMPILPGSDGDGINIYKAETYNRYIHASAAEFGAYYIDIASAFANSSGYLRIDCDAGASCLNTTGLKRLLELLRTYDIPKITEE